MVNEDNPNVQQLELNESLLHAVYEIQFTENELHGNETFCKGISDTIYRQYTIFFVIICRSVADIDTQM